MHWLQKESKERTLILQGPGGLGKTQLACAILSGACFFVESLDTVKNLKWRRGESVVLDDISLARCDVTDVKSWSHHVDRQIPAGTRRIIFTNCKFKDFVPKEVFIPNTVVEILVPTWKATAPQ